MVKYETRKFGRAIRRATGLDLITSMKLGKLCAQARTTDVMRHPNVVTRNEFPVNEDPCGRWDYHVVVGPKGEWNVRWSPAVNGGKYIG